MGGYQIAAVYRDLCKVTVGNVDAAHIAVRHICIGQIAVIDNVDFLVFKHHNNKLHSR